MDSNLLMLSFLFGLVGTGFFMYGKKSGRTVPLGAGVALIVVPYFIPSALAMLVVCSAISLVPWLMRNS